MRVKISTTGKSADAQLWPQKCSLAWVDPGPHLIHTHTFNGPLSGTTQVSRYQKGKNNLDFTEARGSEWQWHQLGGMQVCTSLQTDNHASTPPLSFLQAGCSSCRPTNSVKALKAQHLQHPHPKQHLTHRPHYTWVCYSQVVVNTVDSSSRQSRGSTVQYTAAMRSQRQTGTGSDGAVVGGS